jgi:alkanesulfonate monooxygenase SsuD/methylene tetrahydromethanopterin reductase-like flavin-dependent oxidoreductase (luciferase family)
MKFGLFEHMDDSGVPLGRQFESRLSLLEAADRYGFHAYHLAEHHGTPLGLAPSPGLFLAAVAQRTKRLRFGPLAYSLPLYHPIRLIEEICMLDQMSGGRFELGGISTRSSSPSMADRFTSGGPWTARAKSWTSWFSHGATARRRSS